MSPLIAARTGRDGIPDLDFYMAFNLFRLAGIVHGIKGRLVRGTAASAHAAEMVERLEPLAELGLGAGGEGRRALGPCCALPFAPIPSGGGAMAERRPAAG